MAVRDDPDASAATVVGSALMTALLAAVTGHLYRPLFRHRREGPSMSAPDTAAPATLETSAV